MIPEFPNSAEAEKSLLACCLIDGSDTVARCVDSRLTPAVFFAPANQIIFGKMLDLHRRGLPIDTAIVAEELKAGDQLDAIGGYAYLVEVSKNIPTTATEGYFIKRVRDLPRT